tara:strand:- start:1029 stop:1226 length:198 start_codon:yes stop_codon:yes gene_type:complete
MTSGKPEGSSRSLLLLDSIIITSCKEHFAALVYVHFLNPRARQSKPEGFEIFSLLYLSITRKPSG